MKHNGRRIGFVSLCVIPATVLFFLFMVIPTINVFRLSLYKATGSRFKKTMEFNGMKNFEALFKDENFIRAMKNTIFVIVVVTIITFAFAIVFAAILTREKLKGQNFFRIIFYIPNILSITVIAGIFSSIYDQGSDKGLLDAIIAVFVRHPVETHWKYELAITSLIIAMVWQAIGYYMVMYMASMSAVSESLYESAGLDGAGRIKQFFQITLPLIWTNIRTTLTFFIISTINMAFLFIEAMWGSQDAPQKSALTFMKIQPNQNYQMAAAAVIFLFSFALSALVNQATKRDALQY